MQRLSAMGRSRYERLAKNWDAQMQKALEEEQKEKKQKEEAEEANRQQWLHWMEWQNYWSSQQMAYDARQWYYPPGMEHHNPSHAAQPSNPAPTVAQAKPKVHASPQDATPKGKGKGKKKAQLQLQLRQWLQLKFSASAQTTSKEQHKKAGCSSREWW